MTRYDWYSNGLMTWYRILCYLLLIPACPSHWLKFFNKQQLVQSVYFGHFVLSYCVKHLYQKGLNCTIVSSLRCRRWKGTCRNPQTPATHTACKGQKLIHIFFRDIFVQWECMNRESKARPSLCSCPPYISMISVYNVSPLPHATNKEKRKIVGAVKKIP